VLVRKAGEPLPSEWGLRSEDPDDPHWRVRKWDQHIRQATFIRRTRHRRAEACDTKRV